MSAFVACITKSITDGLFEGKSRLYAFPMKPVLPTKDEFIIIDSGAYGLSLKGKEIDATHMFKLANFYRKYGASNQMPILGIAPDKFHDAQKTQSNYKFWIENTHLPVVPVIQFSKNKIDFFEAKRQIDFYLTYKNKVFAISNPSLRGKEAFLCKMIIDYLRKKAVTWVHCLGAGWNAQDCKDWFALGFDSIDSISYYTDAQRGMSWTPFSYQVRQSNEGFEELALRNYKLANDF